MTSSERAKYPSAVTAINSARMMVAMAYRFSDLYEAKNAFQEAGVKAAEEARSEGVEINGWDGDRDEDYEGTTYIDLRLKECPVFDGMGLKAVAVLANNSDIHFEEAA